MAKTQSLGPRRRFAHSGSQATGDLLLNPRSGAKTFR